MLKNRRTMWVGIVVMMLLIGGGAAYFLFNNGQVHYDNLKNVKAASGLAVVLPKTLPPGSVVANHPSYDTVTGSIMTRVQISGYDVTFTQQKRPGTDLKQVDAAETFLVNVGSVYVLKSETDRIQAIVETADSWLMVNADAKLGVTAFRAVIESLDII